MWQKLGPPYKLTLTLAMDQNVNIPCFIFFRCGDILLAVNGRSTSGMIHACLAKMLKELKGKITLTIVSWPGTFL